MSEEKRRYYCIIPADVLDDERIPDGAKLLYGEITALCSEKGYCFASNEYLASRRHKTKWTIISWLNCLVDCGYIKRELVYEADKQVVKERRLYLRESHYTQFEKSNEGGSKNQTTQFEKSNEGGSKNQTDNNTINNTINNTVDIYTPEFEKFWKMYPRKVVKREAFKHWNARLKEGVTVDELMTCLSNYCKQIQADHTEEKYIKYPSGFLGKDRYFEQFKEYHSASAKREALTGQEFIEGELPF